MKNWKELVGFQEASAKVGVALILVANVDGFKIIKQSYDCIYTEEEVINLIKEALRSFTIKSSAKTEEDLLLAKKHVAEKCKRGMANKNWENTWFYKGVSQYDAPIIVTQFGDKYGFVKSPNFNNYGFVLEA